MRMEASRLKPPLACRVSIGFDGVLVEEAAALQESEHAALQRALEALHVIGGEVRRLVEVTVPSSPLEKTPSKSKTWRPPP
jgi:hypothetical protein